MSMPIKKIKTVSRLLLIVLFFPGMRLSAAPNLITNSDFSLSGVYDYFLFPEADYLSHPTVLGSLSKDLLIFDFKLLEDYSWNQSERLDDTAGVLGGTVKNQDFFLINSLDLQWLSPKKDKIVGWGGFAGFDWTHLKTEYDDYNAFTQSEVHETQTIPFSLGTRGLWASKKPNNRWGYLLDYTFSYQKAFFTWVTDATQDPILKYVEYTGNDGDFYNHQVDLRGDWGKTTGNMDITFAAFYGFTYSNRDTRYLPVDTTGDGFYDTLMEYSVWAEFTGTGGPDEPADSFDQQDRTFGHKAVLDMVLRFELTKNLEMLLLGTYTPLDLSTRTYFTRMTTPSILKDESWESKTRSQDFGNFSVGPVFSIKSAKKAMNWRFGLEYSRSAKTLILDGAQISGLGLYSRNNPDNYKEVSLGINPVKGTILGLDIDPSLEVEHRLSLQGGWEWRVSNTIRLFSILEIAGSYGQDHYRVFNTDTQTVWEEKIGTLGVAWTARPRVGLIIPLGKKLMFVGDMAAFTVPGSYDQSLNTSPHDLTVGRVSEDGSVDLTQRGNLGFDITLKFVIEP